MVQPKIWLGTVARTVLIIGAILFVAAQVRADATPLSGTGSVSIDTSDDFTISGPSISMSSYAPYGPNETGFCTGGTTCDLTFTIPTFGCAYSTGTADGQSGCISGSLTFAASELLPVMGTSDPTSVVFTVPVTITGDLTGFENPSANLFDLDITGSGTATISGIWDSGENMGGYVFESDNYSFTGFASAPEPPAWLLLLSGIAIVAFVTWWKKWRYAPPSPRLATLQHSGLPRILANARASTSLRFLPRCDRPAHGLI